jgi:hypothetical protein
MQFALNECIKGMNLPDKYLRAKKNSWDKRVEKTVYIATGETSKEMKEIELNNS